MTGASKSIPAGALLSRGTAHGAFSGPMFLCDHGKESTRAAGSGAVSRPSAGRPRPKRLGGKGPPKLFWFTALRPCPPTWRPWLPSGSHRGTRCRNAPPSSPHRRLSSAVSSNSRRLATTRLHFFGRPEGRRASLMVKGRTAKPAEGPSAYASLSAGNRLLRKAPEAASLQLTREPVLRMEAR